MDTIGTLEDLERRTYVHRHDDGLLDLLAGLGLALMGASWLTDFAWAGGIAPALLIPIWIQLRKSITAPRAGTVEFRAGRRALERRKFVGLILLAAAALAAGVVTYVRLRADVPADWTRHVMPALPGLLLAVGAVMSALLFGVRRFLIYAMVLVVAAGAAVEQGLEPGVYMAEVGVFMTVVGAVMLVVFLHKNPPPDLGDHA